MIQSDVRVTRCGPGIPTSEAKTLCCYSDTERRLASAYTGTLASELIMLFPYAAGSLQICTLKVFLCKIHTRFSSHAVQEELQRLSNKTCERYVP